MDSSPMLDLLLTTLPTVSEHHSTTCALYALLKQVARREVVELFSSTDPMPRGFGPLGQLSFPYHKMGAVDSLNLFDMDELILFSFYWQNRSRYRRVLDIGANIGLHSIVMSKCGFSVQAFEPDPVHFELHKRNMQLNGCSNVETIQAAVSSRSGTAEFTRVVGNTTGSHLSGSKENPYGPLERFQVKVVGIDSLLGGIDLVKIDAEGHEREILLATNREHWRETDALIEIGSERNAAGVFEHFRALDVSMFAQKINWQRVQAPTDMPTSHRDGSLFVSTKAGMPWR